MMDKSRQAGTKARNWPWLLQEKERLKALKGEGAS